MTSKDKSITTCIKYLNEIRVKLNIIESTFVKACEILKNVEDAGVGKNLKINVKCGTIMFMACRMTNNCKEL
jgi:hypothetical protein